MIVVYRNGERRVISGWREWLFWLAAALAVVVFGGLMFGVALTVFTILLFTLPLALLMGLVAAIVLPRK